MSQGEPQCTAGGRLAAYWQVSRSAAHAGAEPLLGISGRSFRRVFLGTFSGSMLGAVLSAWLLRRHLPPGPAWARVAAALACAGIWLVLVQPLLDLVIIKVLGTRTRLDP